MNEKLSLAQNQIRDLEAQLAAALNHNRELEKEIVDLRACLSNQVWSQDNAKSEWLKKSPDVITCESTVSEETKDLPPLKQRGRSKTVIDSSVLTKLRIEKQDIQLKEMVGKGSFGVVWKAQYRENVVAIKIFVSEEVDVSREVNTMAKTKGLPHVLDLIGLVIVDDDPYNPSQIALVMKFMSNGSLQDLCYKDSPMYYSSLSNEMRIKFAYQAAKGISQLHSKHIIHRDLACRNLLVDDKMDVYVADFGFARLKQISSSKEFTATRLGPVRWEAPESLEHKEYSEKTDSFSFGVCLYELVLGKQPWDECSSPTLAALNVLRGYRQRISLNCDPILAEIMTQCWAHQPPLRPDFHTLTQVLGDRHKEVIEDARDALKELDTIEFMIRGEDVLKYPFTDEGGRTKKPHTRFLRLTSDLKSLLWRSSGRPHVFSTARTKNTERQINVREVTEVKVGYSSDNFKRQLGGATAGSSSSFSLITSNRTLDITCESSQHRDQWVWGIRFLLNRQKRNESVGGIMFEYRSLMQSFQLLESLEHSNRRLSQKVDLVLLESKTTLFDSHAHMNCIRKIIYRLQRGEVMIKFTSRKTHARRVCLSIDLAEITWSSEEDGPVRKGRNKSILLTEIQSVIHSSQPRLMSGSAKVAAVATSLGETLRFRRPSVLSPSALEPSPQKQSKKGSVEPVQPDDTQPKRKRRNSIGNKSVDDSLASLPTMSPPGTNWMQNLIPSLMRERSDDGAAGAVVQPPGHLDEVASMASADSSLSGDGIEDEDYQLCVSYLGADGRTLLAIRCPNRDVFELWTDGLAILIEALKSSRQHSAPSYDSATDFDKRQINAKNEKGAWTTTAIAALIDDTGDLEQTHSKFNHLRGHEELMSSSGLSAEITTCNTSSYSNTNTNTDSNVFYPEVKSIRREESMDTHVYANMMKESKGSHQDLMPLGDSLINSNLNRSGGSQLQEVRYVAMKNSDSSPLDDLPTPHFIPNSQHSLATNKSATLRDASEARILSGEAGDTPTGVNTGQEEEEEEEEWKQQMRIAERTTVEWQ